MMTNNNTNNRQTNMFRGLTAEGDVDFGHIEVLKRRTPTYLKDLTDEALASIINNNNREFAFAVNGQGSVLELIETIKEVSEEINPPFDPNELVPIRLPTVHFLEMQVRDNALRGAQGTYDYLVSVLKALQEEQMELKEKAEKDGKEYDGYVIVFVIHGFTSNATLLASRCLDGLQNLPKKNLGQIFVMPLSWEDSTDEGSFNSKIAKKSFSSLTNWSDWPIDDSVNRAIALGRSLVDVLNELKIERYGLVSHSMGTHAADVVMGNGTIFKKPMFNMMLNPHVYKDAVKESLRVENNSYLSVPTFIVCNENDKVLAQSKMFRKTLSFGRDQRECLGDVTGNATVLVGPHFKTYIIRDFEASINDPSDSRHSAFMNPILKKMVGASLSRKLPKNQTTTRITSREIDLKLKRRENTYCEFSVTYRSPRKDLQDMHQSIMNSMTIPGAIQINWSYDFPVKTSLYRINMENGQAEWVWLESWLHIAL